LLIFFGPLLLPKAIAYYKSARSGPKQHGLAVQPVPHEVSRGLIILSCLTLAFLVKSLPYFGPENLFVTSQSRLQIPVDVLFNRISAIRPSNTLTAYDAALRVKFVNAESRLLYLQFGPDVLATCPFCSSDEPKTYFYYALPAILISHLVNIALVAFVTSPFFSGKYGMQWRTIFTIAAATVISIDVYLVNTYNYQANSRALRLNELDMFFWTARSYRCLALAALDGLLGWVLYLSSTNRAFAKPPSTAQRIEAVNRALSVVKSKLNALAIVGNTISRDEDLRMRGQSYWAHEGRLMAEMMEEREVIEGVNDALENRINIQSITKDAETYAQSVLQSLQAPTTTR
jgi:hypothetical protein